MEKFFIFGVCLIYSLYTIILILVSGSAKKRKILNGQQRNINPYAKTDSIILAILISIEVLILILFILKLPFLLIFNIKIALFIRITFLLIGLMGVSLIGWASYTLDGEFSATIQLKEQHRLITIGPYKYVRHPIYSGFILLHIGVTFALSNLLIIIIYNLGLFLLLLERIPREEKVLHSFFGEKWEQYYKKTPKFIPIKKNR